MIFDYFWVISPNETSNLYLIVKTVFFDILFSKWGLMDRSFFPVVSNVAYFYLCISKTKINCKLSFRLCVKEDSFYLDDSIFPMSTEKNVQNGHCILEILNNTCS